MKLVELAEDTCMGCYSNSNAWTKRHSLFLFKSLLASTWRQLELKRRVTRTID